MDLVATTEGHFESENCGKGNAKPLCRYCTMLETLLVEEHGHIGMVLGVESPFIHSLIGNEMDLHVHGGMFVMRLGSTGTACTLMNNVRSARNLQTAGEIAPGVWALFLPLVAVFSPFPSCQAAKP